MGYLLNGKLDAVDRKETLRYLGYYNKPSPARKSEETLLAEMGEVIDECEKLVLEAQNLRAVYEIYDVVWGQSLDLGFAKVQSHSLARNLKGCEKIVLFAATAGAGIDRLIVKYNRLSPARAVVLQAMGAAVIEQWCDMICARLRERYGANRARFSCGYGDLPLTLQRDIFTALNVTKHLGITLSDNCFMTPTKSVTAIVGIKTDENL